MSHLSWRWICAPGLSYGSAASVANRHRLWPKALSTLAETTSLFVHSTPRPEKLAGAPQWDTRSGHRRLTRATRSLLAAVRRWRHSIELTDARSGRMSLEVK